MSLDNSATRHSSMSVERATADQDDLPSPTFLLTEEDGTNLVLSHDVGHRNSVNAGLGIANNLEDRRSQRASIGLENGDFFSLTKSNSGGTPSDGPTTVRDHGDTARLNEPEAEPSQLEPLELPRSSDNDLVGIGRGVTDEDIWTSIDDQLVSPPPHDGRQFLPLNELKRTISKPNVRRALENLRRFTSHQVHDYANQVCDTTQLGDTQKTTRHRMFATLVIIEHIEALPSLIAEGLHDVHLPFALKRDDTANKWHLYYKPTPDPDESYVLFKGSCSWNNPKVKAFHEKQWLVLSPFFNMQAGKPLFHPLESRIILPFIEGDGQQNMTFGGYSTVWRAKIHPAHHNYPPSQDPDPTFAIKQLHSDNKVAFDREAEAMKKINRQKHQHLTTLLATYQHHGHWYFVFPWADGNLREFWQDYPEPKRDHSLVIWVAEQCAGIASGLKLIQHPPRDTSLNVPDSQDFGRHGDLKPENVLWFRNGNHNGDLPEGWILKIADFGLTRFHRFATKSGENASKLSVSLTYKAPEVDVTVEVSQSYDIWTLGCLLLEFVTWYLKGWDGVDKFSQLRVEDDEGNDIPLDTFYNIVTRRGEKGAVIKTSVKKWIQDLHLHPDCSLFFHRLLTYILHHLLCPGAKDRHKCGEVVEKLEGMVKECKADDKYACTGCPKPPRKTDTTRSNNTISDDGHPTPGNVATFLPKLATYESIQRDDFVRIDNVPDNESALKPADLGDHAVNGIRRSGSMEQSQPSSVSNMQPKAVVQDFAPASQINRHNGSSVGKETRKPKEARGCLPEWLPTWLTCVH